VNEMPLNVRDRLYLYDRIPDRFRLSLMLYRDQRVETGGALRTILEGRSLVSCLKYADDELMDWMATIACWIYNEFPITCCGSAEKVERWLSER